MSRVRPPCVALLLLLLVPTAVPRHAAAQFGRIKKAVGVKAADAVGVPACVADRPPTYVESIAFSEEQIRKINAGLDAELARAQSAQREYEQSQKNLDRESQAYQKAREAYEKQQEQWQKCADKVAEADTKKSDELHAKAEATTEAGTPDQERLEAMAERAQAAAERVANGTATAEDRKTLAEFQQAGAELQANAGKMIAANQEAGEYDQAAKARMEKACGKEPTAPDAPANQTPTPERAIEAAGAQAAGMSAAAYRELKEPVVAFAMSNTVVKPGKSGQGRAGEAKPDDSQSGTDGVNNALRETAKRVCQMRKAGMPI